VQATGRSRGDASTAGIRTRSGCLQRPRPTFV